MHLSASEFELLKLDIGGSGVIWCGYKDINWDVIAGSLTYDDVVSSLGAGRLVVGS